MHPKYKSLSVEEYKRFTDGVNMQICKLLASHELNPEQALEILAATMGMMFVNVKLKKGEFEMRMVETNITDLLATYLDNAQRAKLSDVIKTFGPDGEEDTKDFKCL